MIPQISILCKGDTPEAAHIIEKFEPYFHPMFRNLDEFPLEELHKQYVNPVAYIGKTANGYVPGSRDQDPVLLLSHYNPEKEDAYVEAICRYLNSEKADKKVKEVIKDFKVPTSTMARPEYEFVMESYRVWTIVSIKRPDPEDSPFTFALKTSKEEMFELLFVFLSMDPAWGFFSTDMQFLQALWENEKSKYGFEGALDEDCIQAIMHKPGYESYFLADSRPKIYRQGMSQVKRMLDRELEELEFI